MYLETNVCQDDEYQFMLGNFGKFITLNNDNEKIIFHKEIK